MWVALFHVFPILWLLRVVCPKSDRVAAQDNLISIGVFMRYAGGGVGRGGRKCVIDKALICLSTERKGFLIRFLRFLRIA